MLEEQTVAHPARFVALAAALVAQAPPAQTPVMTEKSAGDGAARPAGVPVDRAGHAVRPRRRPGGARERPATFYIGHGDRRRLQDDQRRRDLHAGVRQRRHGSVGAIAIAPTDANLVWVGTGEGNNRQSSSWGDGVYQVHRRRAHVDEHGPAGQQADRPDHRRPGRLPSVVYVAALGDLWAAGGERGVFKTTDGGGSPGRGCCTSTTTPAAPSW